MQWFSSIAPLFKMGPRLKERIGSFWELILSFKRSPAYCMEKHYFHNMYFFHLMCTFFITNYSCEDRIEQSVPREHRLWSLGTPRDAKRRPLGRIVLSYHHTHDSILYVYASYADTCISWSAIDFDVMGDTTPSYSLSGWVSRVTTYVIAWMLQTRSMTPSLIYTVSFSLRKVVQISGSAGGA